MQIPPLTCFLALCISLGAALECEECLGVGNNCNGQKITCPPDRGSCGIILTELLGQRGLVKTCVTPRSCQAGFAVLNMGPVGTQKTLVSCCVGEECGRSTVTLPERNTTLNGRKCPACYAHQKTCDETMAECAGDEFSCFEMSGTSTMGHLVTSIVMKGCANKGACYDLEHGESSFGSFSVVHKARCTDGASPGGTSGFWGLFLPILSGLLLTKFLV